MKQSRRDFLKLITMGGAAIGSGFLLSGIMDLFRFRERRGLQLLGSVEQLRKRPSQSIEGEDLLLIKRSTGIVVLNRICTHKGCLLTLADELLQCPCHAGVFSLKGEVVSGEPKKALTRFAILKKGEKLYVDRSKEIALNTKAFAL